MDEVQRLIDAEYARQQTGIELIASENYQSPAVLKAQASVFANKYAEGYPGRRYYGGNRYTDELEHLAIDRAKALFHCDHANVQALSGANANLCFYTAVMKLGDTILGMDLTHGGHLTHGAPVTFFSHVFNFQRYQTLPTGEIDFAQVRQLARDLRPQVILAGFSAYPRELEYAKFAEIAQESGSILYADISHIGGFIAAGLLKNPFDEGFHAAMTTTHKSLRGPRGALLLSQGKVSNPLKKPEDTLENLPTRIDRAVFPGFQGGPHMHTIAGIAIALEEATTPAFRQYAQQALLNAQILASDLQAYGYQLVTGGTDNHMVILDFTGTGLDGASAEELLESIGISTSKSTIPNDPNPPFRPSGLRIGTPAMTTRGVKESGMHHIATFIHQALSSGGDETILTRLQAEVTEFCTLYPLP